MIEPELLRKRAPLLSEEQFNKFMAMHTVESTNVAFENFRYFAAIVMALNGVVPNFTIYETPEVPHIWYAIKQIKKLRPKMEFAEEIKEFVKIVSNEQGYFIYPPELEIPSSYKEIAEELSKRGPFPLGETTEEIQAAKLLEIEHYINRMNRDGNR